MKEPFPHDIRAVLTAPGKGLSLKKIFTASLFLLIGYICYLVFTYLALLYDGTSLTYLLKAYGFFPFKLFAFDAAVSMVIYGIGLLLTMLAVSLAILGCAVLNFEEMRGGYFYSARKAIRFAFSRVPTLILCHISLGAFVALIVALGMIVGLIGRIPLVGELLISIFYIIPIFISLAFTVFVIFVLTVATIFLPVVLAAQKKKETFDGLLQLFSVMIREPIRFFWYSGISAVAAKVASFVFAYLFYRTVQFSQFLLVTTGGEKIERMFNSAFAMLPLDTRAVAFMTNIFPGIDFGFSVVRWGYGSGGSIGAVFLAISFFLLFLVLCGYMVSVFATGMARGYVVIRRMKDDYFIVEEPPMETAEDYANPPFVEDESEA